jgi:hypothetical protein
LKRVPGSRRLVAGGVAVVAALLVALALGRSDERAAAAGAKAFPAPPKGATVYARQLGNDALALAVVPRGGTSLVAQAAVIGRQGNGVRGLRVTFVVEGMRRAGRPCGAGCYRATFAPAHAPRAVDVAVAGRTRTPWHVELPAAWPPRDARALVGRAARAWRALDSLTFDERLASGVNIAVSSTWRIQRPDRVAYEVRGGWAGIVIGARRWDRAPGARRWQASEQTRLHQPVPPWVEVADAHVLGPLSSRGRDAVRVSFFDPGTPAWFTLVLDRSTYRTLDLRMVTNAHFMHDLYRAFDSTPPILPPR